MGVWNRWIGWLLDNRLVVFLVAAVVLVAGLRAAPFDWDLPFARDPVPVDAIPDIGENQQIVFTTWDGRSPRDVEDQITYPLTTALLGIPGVRTVRSASAFGFSTIYIIFEDDVDFYWSRSRVLEKLASLPPGTLPPGVTPTLGPDATALGQIFWYTLEGRDPQGRLVGGWDPDELRTIQDWYVRYALQAVPGVSEVASIGGHVKEYQVDVDETALRAHQVTLAQVAAAVKGANLDVGARTMEINQVEFVVRGLGFVKKMEDLEQAVVAVRDNVPIRVADVARVTIGPALRRGALDDAGAPAVGGVVVARYLENPLQVIDAVKEKIAHIAPGLPKKTLPDGTVSQVTIVPFYDRTDLIHETLDTLSSALLMEILITVIVVLILLRNLRSSLLVSAMLPVGVLATFVAMKYAGVGANIMALGGIAIAIGTMVDIGIVFVENMNQHLDALPPGGNRAAAVRAATAEVAPAVLTSVATTVVSFIPVFGLSASELRLFAPLAATKTLAMSLAYLLSVLVLPGLALVVLRSRPGRPAAAAGWRAVARGALRAVHLRDWALVALGAWLVRHQPAVGVVAVAAGLFRLVRPWLPEVWARRGALIESLAAAAAVVLALAAFWAPLGPESAAANVGFTAVLVGGLLGGFRLFEMAYPRILRWCLAHKRLFVGAMTAVVLFGAMVAVGFSRLTAFVPASWKHTAVYAAASRTFPGLGREYMPPFDEGAYLYMPTTMPHASIGAVEEMLSTMDAAIAQIPEVDRVVGKLGRVDSALDPAPISMIETVITYKPEYETLPDGTRRRVWRDHIRSPRDIWEEIVAAARMPGVTSAPVLMPIAARIVMLQSGMRAPMGIKVQGPSLEAIEEFGLQLERILKQSPAVRPESVFADRVVGKPYLEVVLDREAIARYGLSVVDVQHTLQIGVGGIPLTRTVEGRERFPVRVRIAREQRDSPEALQALTVANAQGQHIPLGQLATIRYVKGPQVIKSEDTFLTSYVLFDKQPDVSEVEAVQAADALIKQKIASGALQVPAGVSYRFAGSYENQVRSEKRLMILVPLALLLVFLLLYLQFHRVAVTAMIYSGVLVAVSGGFLLMWLYAQPWFLDFTVFGTSMRDVFRVDTVNLSVAVWIGFIALVGVATDDGVVIATYLQQVFAQRRPTSVEAVRAAVLHAGARRVRPCLMTTATTILALIPVITSQGKGADIMMPMALPSLGGMAIELFTLFVVPLLYSAQQERRVRRGAVA